MSVIPAIILCAAVIAIAESYHVRSEPGACHSNPCLNGGVCSEHHDFPHHTCQCSHGYHGQFCRHHICDGIHCTDGKECHRSRTSPFYTCGCHYGHGGLHCETGACHSNPCLNGGVCSEHHDFPHHTCQCSHGYHGQFCRHGPCYRNPCQSGGVCSEQHNFPYYRCQCYHGYYGHNCGQTTKIPTTTTSTTHSSTTSFVTTSALAATMTTTPEPLPTTPTIVSSTTTVPSDFFTATSPHAASSSIPSSTASSDATVSTYYIQCLKLSVDYDLETLVSAVNANASICPDTGERKSPDAFVLNHCNIPPVTSWKQDQNVMKSCSTIPPYTPIATFENGIYIPYGSMSGVFVGCLQNGFMIGMQQCGSPPLIKHIVVGGAYTMDPNNYFTIQ